MGGGRPKQLLELAGKPILVHTLERFLEFDPQLVACVVLHESLLAGWEEFISQYFTPESRQRILATSGGAERTASVQNGLNALKNSGAEPYGLVAIHDAVRPFVTREMLSNAFQVAKNQGNAVVCVPVKSSLRRKTEQGSEAVDRSLFYHVQTPQIFGLEDISLAYSTRPHDRFTDDASLAEWAGQQIHLCEGTYDNIKITTPEDLALGEIILKGEANP
ncbi:MAG: 2-C-methyl-D-erythritol 4-phosphate cytidylyltransferase [Bacteroidia bacterium]|nr:2-C-methyl-D-erythritol 4-phosphate cytidylyltransferase [Bacteroidia bacterium]